MPAMRRAASYAGLVLACASIVAADLVAYHGDNKAITFSTSPVDKDCSDITKCLNNWWTQKDITGTTLYYTAGPSTSLQLAFKGSMVTLYGRTLASGGAAAIRLDNGSPFTLSFQDSDGSGDNATWTQDRLDPNQQHTLTVTYQSPTNAVSDSQYPIAIESFMVDTGSSSSESKSDTQEQQDEDDNSKIISLAAGLAGGVALLLALLACAFYWYRRRQQMRPHYEGVHPLNLAPSEHSYGPGGYPPSQQQMRNAGPSAIYPFTVPQPGSHVTSSSQQHPHHTYNSSSSALLGNASHSPSPVPSAHQQRQQDPNVYVQYQPMPPQLLANNTGSSASSSARHQPLPPQRPTPRIDTGLDLAELAPPVRPPSPTETTHSYESWTSSDFGPVPSPFIADGPPVPRVPAHLASSVEKGGRRRPPARPAQAGSRSHVTRTTTRQSNQTALPPYSEKAR
ncbi:hypothetical protein EXIGLDRAFT_836927 [Exidia glandulosa HHB12029]|uniref:Mid2 domain-containing protein n=1 Tax=Exidia glandulosa HHB12029 TaxID=1314781 RepID=A0A165HBH4_EXIGL|nr:hypothetical protein EXIGLDRAFT_836927 [Exidia glandulosa HHB12029]